MHDPTTIPETEALSSDDSFAPLAAAEAADAPEVAVPFTPEAEAELHILQRASQTVGRIELRGLKARAGLTRRQFLFADKYGAASINKFAKDKGYTYQASNLEFHVTSQLLQQVNVDVEADPDKREALQNEVRPLAYALAAMDKWKSEHENLSPDDFYNWFAKQGHTTGLKNRWLEAQRGSTTSGGTSGGTTAMTAEAAEAAEQVSIAQKVGQMLANPAGVEVDMLPGVGSSGPGLLLYSHEGGKVRLVPMRVTLEQLAQLEGSVPHPLENAPRDLLFHRQMLMAGVAFVPDIVSKVTREEVPEGDVANETYSFENAFGMYLVENGNISIAHGRMDDGVILEVMPRNIDVGYSLVGEKFIDNLTRRRTLDELMGETSAADYAASASSSTGYAMTRVDEKTTLTFTQKAGGKSVNLIVKPRQMGGVWTYRVSPAFAPIAQAVVDGDGFAAIRATFLKELYHKKAPEDRPVMVEVADGKLRLTNGKAAAMPFDAASTNKGKARVMLVDIRHALECLFDLPLVGGMTWKVDPKGLLLIEAATDLATYRVYVQTLEENRDTAIRSRALRERVESLPRVEAAQAA